MNPSLPHLPNSTPFQDYPCVLQEALLAPITLWDVHGLIFV